jgi:hypothetical protein
MTLPGPRPITGSAAKLIYCLVPDDGTDKRLLRILRDHHVITRANSSACRAVSILRAATTRRGKLPEPQLARIVTVIVDQDQADTMLDFIYEHAKVGRPGGGMVMMASIALATPFLMPEGVPDETGE